MRSLVGRSLDVGVVTGPRGRRAPLLLPVPDWDDYVSLSFDEPIETGADHGQVRRRLERLLRDLIAVAPESRRPPLRTRLVGLTRLSDERTRERT